MTEHKAQKDFYIPT